MDGAAMSPEEAAEKVWLRLGGFAGCEFDLLG
jgi:hypothetical protein